MQTSELLSPQERLAISRKAIINHMNRRGHHNNASANISGYADDAAPADPVLQGMQSRLKQAVRSWWYHHPASVAVELVRPLLGDYASAHPFKLLALSAGVGAAAVLVRPWRMVSVGSLALAGLKSSGLSGIVLSLLTNRSFSSQNNEETP